MATLDFFKEEFDRLATDGFLGSPTGPLAYGYLRVSSSDQADEGRSGLPRQMLHCHEAALKHGYRIPWALIFADDHSGFEFRERPILSQLRAEYKKPNRRAHVVVIESLDRLSRNADWHQGFLLDEMKDHHLQVVFWKSFNSRIERAVMGAIAQEGMEQAKQRMAEGTLMKAQRGMVTAKFAAYGYHLVDAQGQASEAAKKDTHYAIVESEARVVRLIFERVAGAGWSLQQLVKWLGAHVPPIRNAQIWTTNHLRLIVRNPVYKGEFIAHRWVHIRLRANDEHPGEPERQVWRKVQRPPEEWVRVPVPAIVPPDVWEQANRMLDQNKLTASRNGKSQYLLTGLLACAQCEWAYVGKRRPRRKGGQVYYSRSYFCCRGCGETINYPKCGQGSISCRVLETAVWRVVSRVLLEPDILISALEQAYASGPNAELLREIAYLDQQTTETAGEDELLYRAYVAKAFDEAEYAARRQALKERVRQLAEERQKLAARVVSLEKLERTKRCILQVAAAAQAGGWEADPPHAVKKTIIKIVVDKIRVNVREGWFDLNGAARGRYPIHPEATGSIVETSARTDALAPPPSAHDR